MEIILPVLFGLFLLAAPDAVQAQFSYATNANGISLAITSYYGAGGAVSIPDAVNGLPVTSIEYGAFFFDIGVTSVTIPDGVTSIGDWAFFGCESLTGVTIPGSVTNLGNLAFGDCTSLKKVNFQGNAPSFVGSDVFYGDSSATVIYCPCATGWGATFAGRPTMEPTAEDQFDYTTNSGAITITGYFGVCDAVIIPTNINGLPVTSIGFAAFGGCTSLSNIAIPGSITSIGAYAFFECYNLSSVTIAYGVTNIGAYAFRGCGFLADVTIPASVITIGEGAFWGCGLTSVTLADGLTSIGDDAFVFCFNLSSVTIPGSVTNIGEGAFFDCSGLTHITIANGVTDIGGEAFSYTPLTNVTIPASVTNIGIAAFEGCRGLTSITILGSFTSTEGAFEYCPLASVFFGGNAPTVFEDFIGGYVRPTVYYLPGTTGWSNTFEGYTAVLWNPTIQANGASFGVRSNQFGFSITSATIIPIMVDACTNLASPVWTPLQTLKLTNGSFYFSDPQWTNFPARFYRISAP